MTLPALHPSIPQQERCESAMQFLGVTGVLVVTGVRLEGKLYQERFALPRLRWRSEDDGNTLSHLLIWGGGVEVKSRQHAPFVWMMYPTHDFCMVEEGRDTISSFDTGCHFMSSWQYTLGGIKSTAASSSHDIQY